MALLIGDIVLKGRRRRNRPLPTIEHGAQGFAYFFDRLMTYGLELFGLYYGIYRAEVMSTDDPDNEGQPDPHGRLTVRVPSVGDNQDVRRLAWPIAPLAGPGYGFKTMPPVGDHVYVRFEGGRLDAPLWSGGWWAQDDIPEDLQKPESHGWYTPGGHQILLDEQDNGQVIRIKHMNGETRLEFDNDGSIFIVNKSGQKVNIGDGAENADEPGVLGNTLKGLMEDLINAINAITVPTPAGPSGQPINRPRFEAIKAQLQTMLSQTIQVK